MLRLVINPQPMLFSYISAFEIHFSSIGGLAFFSSYAYVKLIMEFQQFASV